MAHCTRCGASVDATAVYCQECGLRQPVEGVSSGAGSVSGGGAAQASAASGQAVAGAGAQSGLKENVAATLSYAAFWITGIIFLLVDKRPYVQFHAAQSLVVFGGLWLLRSAVALVFGLSFAFRGDWDDWSDWGAHGMGRSVAMWGAGGLLLGLIQLATLALWIVLMIKAYQGEKYRVPIAADLVDSIAGK